MSFLLDTDICSAHLKRPSGLMHRFIQHQGRLHISSITLAELYTWAYRRSDPTTLLNAIEDDLLADVQVIEFDNDAAREFGRIRAILMGRGVTVSRIDLMIACVALKNDLTMVTHNTKDFEHIPDLQLEDWLT